VISATTVIVRFTTLGDSGGYATDNPLGYEEKGGGLLSSTGIVLYLGYQIGKIVGFNFNAVAMIFQTIAFVGIVALLNAVDRRDRLLLFVFFLSPSFTLWSSLPGKEAFVVLFTCMILRGFARSLNGKAMVTPLFIVAVILLAIFKLQYLVALFFLFVTLAAGRFVTNRELLLLVGGLASIAILFAFRGYLEELVPLTIQPHFVGDAARSTRDLFFKEYGDVFGKMGEGMLLAFVGPTVFEVGISIVHLASFIESLILLGFLLLVIVWRSPSMPVFCLMLAGFVIFWIVFANYPMGVLNPGTAIRYRSGWLPVIAFSVVVLTSRRVYENWIGIRRRSDVPPTRPGAISQST